jgi:hypothetical protein
LSEGCSRLNRVPHDWPNEPVAVLLMAVDLSLIGELDHAVAAGSDGRRTEMLRHVTDLFIVEAAKLSDKEIELFDDVIARLAFDIELSARSLLAIRLAPIRNAPPKTIRSLAFDDAIEVAALVLSQSERLGGGIDRISRPLHAGPIQHVVTRDNAPARRELITGFEREIRHRGKACLHITADIARQRQQSALIGRGTAAAGLRLLSSR